MDHVNKIHDIIDYIRQQEIKPGTTVRRSITLATCPADMNRIEWHLAGYATIIRAQVIEELAQKAEEVWGSEVWPDYPDGEYSSSPTPCWFRDGRKVRWEPADWLRSQDGGENTR